MEKKDFIDSGIIVRRKMIHRELKQRCLNCGVDISTLINERVILYHFCSDCRKIFFKDSKGEYN